MEADPLLTCRLCLSLLKDPKQLPCYHNFCSACLQKSDPNIGDDFHCPTCGNSFEISLENLEDLQTNPFISRLVSIHDKSADQFSTERSCEQHPSAKINFFCVDCEVAGCPICSTGRHDNHRCIDLNEMGGVVRDEIKNMSTDLKTRLTWMKAEICKNNQQEADKQKLFDEVSKDIRERGELVKSAINDQVKNLLKQVETVKSRSAKACEQLDKKNKNLTVNVVQSFITYMDQLIKQGTPEELIECVRDVKTRSDNLKQVRVCHRNNEELGVNFIPSDLHVSTLSLVGHVELLKTKTSKSQERCGDKRERIKQTAKHDSTNLSTSDEDKNAEFLDLASQMGQKVQRWDLPRRKVPECKHVTSINLNRSVAAVAVGGGELFVAIEHSGDVLRYNVQNFGSKLDEILIEGLETPWDMTAISSDEMSTTYLFVIDNLQGKVFQVNVPYNSKVHPSKFVRKSWNLGLSESATISSTSERLLVASTANKIIEYTLSSLLITSLSSSSSTALSFPDSVTSISLIPHMTDVLHAVRISNDRLVAFFDHLYSLSGGFLINGWGKMIRSFGEGRGSLASCQIDYPSHISVDRKKVKQEELDEHDEPTFVKMSGAMSREEEKGEGSYNDEAFVFVCDNGNSRVSLFDGDLKFLKVVVEKVDEPWRMCLDEERCLLFISTLQHTVNVYKY